MVGVLNRNQSVFRDLAAAMDNACMVRQIVIWENEHFYVQDYDC